MNYSASDNEKELKKRKATGKKIRNKTLIIVFRIIFAVVLIGMFAFGGVVLGAIIGIIEQAPAINTLNVKPSKFNTILFFDGTDVEYDRYKGEEDREYVSYDQIPKYLKDAFVAIEDERFYLHNGVDLKGVARSGFNLIKSGGKTRQGASTITQQLIKNTVNNGVRNDLESKIKEQYLAIKYEKALEEEYNGKFEAKEHILELYLNTIPLHYSLNGVQTAARFYFNKEVSDLTLSECAVIAAITQNPSYFEPVKHDKNNEVRKNTILDKMLEQGYINEEEYNYAYNDDVYSRIKGVNEVVQVTNEEAHTFYSEAVFQQVSEDLQAKYSIDPSTASRKLYNEGYKIYIPIDTNMQNIVDETYKDDSLFPKSGFRIDVTYIINLHNKNTGENEQTERETIVYKEEDIKPFAESVKNELMGPNHEIIADRIVASPQPQSAFVLMDYHNGYIKAISGGRGKKTIDKSFNRATQAKRQSGSVFKVLAAFAPAIDSGKMTPGTIIDDVPFTQGTWSPRNHWGSTYRGLYTIRAAIRDSANIVAIRTMNEIGIDTSMNYLLNFGFTTLITDPSKPKNDYNLSTALGGLTTGVLQTEVAAAFGTIANLGYYNRPKFYTTVFNQDGEKLLDLATEEPRQVLKDGNAYILTSMMRDVITSGTGGAAKLQKTSMPVAGKTGTTSDTKDLTFVGYTPYYVASVWLGYDDGKTNMSGSREHMIIWRTIMDKVHENLEVVEFIKPDNVISIAMCRDSGKLPTRLCSSDSRGSRVVNELFISGTQPTEECDVHISAKVCSESNKTPNEFCPPELIVSKVGIKRKVPYNGTAYVQDKTYEIYYNSGVCDIHNAENNVYIPPIEDNPDVIDDVPTINSPLPSTTTNTTTVPTTTIENSITENTSSPITSVPIPTTAVPSTPQTLEKPTFDLPNQN